MVVTITKAKKRTPGQRAGMNPHKIALAARELWADLGPDKFTIRKLAKKLKIGPTTVHAHFKGGLRELRRAIAKVSLDELTPAYKPKQGPKDYLQNFFRSSLAAFRKSPHLGRLVVLELATAPTMSLTFVERIAATVQSINKHADLVRSLELVIIDWSGLLLIETGAWAIKDPSRVKLEIESGLMKVSGTEFPTLKQAPQKLGALLSKRSSPTYLQETADAAAAILIEKLIKFGV